MKKTTISVQKIGSAPKTTTKTTTKKRSVKKSKQNPLHRITSKNISNKIKNGTILQTRDEFFEGQGNYRKPGYIHKGKYRKIIVIDSNRNDALAVVKLTTQGHSYKVPTLSKSRFRPFIQTLDNENKPIKIGAKFTYKGENVDEKIVNIAKKICLTKPGQNIIQENRLKLKKLKGR